MTRAPRGTRGLGMAPAWRDGASRSPYAHRPARPTAPYFSNRDRRRSARGFPPVWQVGQ